MTGYLCVQKLCREGEEEDGGPHFILWERLPGSLGLMGLELCSGRYVDKKHLPMIWVQGRGLVTARNPLSFAAAAGTALSRTHSSKLEGRACPPQKTRMFNDKYFQTNLAQIPKELEKFTFTEVVNFAVEKVIA